MKKLYPLFGIISPLSYVLVVIIGGFLIQGYSHIYNSISELTASNAHKIPIIFILFALYNITLLLFGFSIFADSEFNSSKKLKIASCLLAIIGALGLSMLHFVQDPRNNEMTFNGKVHIILAGVSSILTMTAIILAGMGVKHIDNLKKLRIYSYISFLVVFIIGGFAAGSLITNSNYVGLFERLTIGTFLQWVFVFALILYKNNNKPRFMSRAPKTI